MITHLDKRDEIDLLRARADLLAEISDHAMCKRLRVEAGWSMTRMARRCRVSARTIRRWERGESWPADFDTLKRYVHAVRHLRIGRDIRRTLRYVEHASPADRHRTLAELEERHCVGISPREWSTWKRELGWPT